MRLGADEHVTFQTARCEPADVQAIVDAAALRPCERPPGPWMPPLPATLGRGEVPPGSIGRCDDPDHQRHASLCWWPADGSVVVAGSAGSGVSSTLHTLACQALTSPDAQVYVLLARSHERLAALDTHPRVVVVEVHERERVMRLVHRLHARLRTAGGSSRVVLLVDGLDAVRRALDHLDTLNELDALDDVLAHGDAAGITTVCGVEHTAALPAAVVSRCSHRWVLHLHDPVDAGALGVAARDVPPGVPGRVFLGESGLTAQLVEPGGTPLFRVREHRRDPTAQIVATPAVVQGTLLPAARHDDATTYLPLGIGMADGEPVVAALPDGDHLLVLGGSRTGRSTMLGRLAEAWREAHPTGHVLAVLPRRSLFPGELADEVVGRVESLVLPTGVDVLVVVDDAELVDDPSGVLAAAAAGGRPGRTVVAAGRPDALRQSYGHWTTVLRRSRTGLVASGGSDSDGDLLSATVPRRTPVPARPGLAWLSVQGTVTLVQVAVPGRHAATPTPRMSRPHLAK
jgi:S-DNA-T family DNA segregation ATPase FtsK/SpoIIIE